jgi:hypothetical protein
MHSFLLYSLPCSFVRDMYITNIYTRFSIIYIYSLYKLVTKIGIKDRIVLTARFPDYRPYKSITQNC